MDLQLCNFASFVLLSSTAFVVLFSRKALFLFAHVRNLLQDAHTHSHTYAHASIELEVTGKLHHSHDVNPRSSASPISSQTTVTVARSTTCRWLLLLARAALSSRDRPAHHRILQRNELSLTCHNDFIVLGHFSRVGHT